MNSGVIRARIQRCTVHTTANILNKVARNVQPQMKQMLHDIWDAPTKKAAEKAFELFEKTFEAKCEAALHCLRKDRDRLLTFYDFPAESGFHIRTTNPIESTFATIHLRHRKTEENGNGKASVTMMLKLALSVSKKWKRLRGHHHIPKLIRDGVREDRFTWLTNSHGLQIHSPIQFKPISSPDSDSLNTTFASNRSLNAEPID